MAASPNTGLIDPRGRAITRSDVLRARTMAIPMAGHSNEAGGFQGTFLGGWGPTLKSADADWFYDRDTVVARARDASRNDVVGASAGKRRVNRAVGAGWRLASRVNASALGISVESAGALRRQIDTQFRLYAKSANFLADADRTKTFGQILRVAAFHLFHDGEAFGVVEWADDEPTRFRTRLRLVDPDRVSNPNGCPDSPTLRKGVQKDDKGRIVGYWIREAHPNDVDCSSQSMIWKYWPRFSTNFDRPQVLHAYEEGRAGQSRGISQFVSVLKSLRGMNKFTDATLEAATINAMFVAFAKSNAGPDAISEGLSIEDYKASLGERRDWYDKNPVTLGGVSIPVLPPDDEIVMQTAARDTGGFDSFVRSVLRLIAAAIGITYEELSMDFSQTNYSSARAALAIAWEETLVFRSILAEKFADPFLVAWLEEAVDTGAVVLPDGAPGFYDAVDAYADHVWIGPGRGTIDPVKEMDASAAAIEAGLSTLEQESAEKGKDWAETLEQLAVEQNYRRSLGLPDPYQVPQTPPSGGNTAQTAEDDRQRDERPAASGFTVGQFVRRAGSALARIAKTSRSAEHNAALDART